MNEVEQRKLHNKGIMNEVEQRKLSAQREQFTGKKNQRAVPNSKVTKTNIY